MRWRALVARHLRLMKGRELNGFDAPVLIVGGGPVGLTLAIDLAVRGQRCILVEQREATTAHPKATLLGARSMEYFRRWGLEDKIYAATINTEDPYYIVFTTRLGANELLRFRSPSIREIRDRDPEALARFRELTWSPYGKTQIGQQALEPILVEHARSLPSIDLRHGWRFEGFTQDEAGVTATITEIASGRSEIVRTQYLAACDGGASDVRRSLGIRFNGRGKMRANVSLLFRSAEFLKVHGRGVANLYFTFAPDCFGVFTAIDGAELWNYQYYFIDPEKAAAPLNPEEVLHRAVGTPFEFELLQTTHWNHHQSVARKWRDGRVFLLGDAAHLFVPTGGVGMNTGIGDACDLGWKLGAVLSGWGGDGLLDSYERERKPIAVRNSIASASNSDRIDMVMDETEADIDRDDALGEAKRAALTEKLRILSRQFNSAGVHLGYRYIHSPIIAADGAPEPPDDPSQVSPSTWPGCRAPHAWLADGRSTLDLFGDGFVLVRLGEARFGDEGFPAAAEEAGMPLNVADIREPSVAALYERRLVLVRPDGHVAWRGDEAPADCAALIARVRGQP